MYLRDHGLTFYFLFIVLSIFVVCLVIGYNMDITTNQPDQTNQQDSLVAKKEKVLNIERINSITRDMAVLEAQNGRRVEYGEALDRLERQGEIKQYLVWWRGCVKKEQHSCQAHLGRCKLCGASVSYDSTSDMALVHLTPRIKRLSGGVIGHNQTFLSDVDMLVDYVRTNLERRPGEGIWHDYWASLQKDPSLFLKQQHRLPRALGLASKVVAINKCVLWLDAHFEGGNLESYRVIHQEAGRAEVEVMVRGDTNRMQTHSLSWFYFSIEAMRDLTLLLRFRNTQPNGMLVTRGADGRWHDAGQIQKGEVTVQVKALEKLLVSPGHPYSFSTLVAFLRRQEERMFKDRVLRQEVTPQEVSIETDRVVYRRQKIGQSGLGLPVYLLHIRSAQTAPRPTLLFLARQGASDGNASLVVQYLLQYLCEENRVSQGILSLYDVAILPMVNIDGPILGNTSSSLNGQDYSSLWDSISPYSPELAAISHTFLSSPPSLFIELTGQSAYNVSLSQPSSSSSPDPISFLSNQMLSLLFKQLCPFASPEPVSNCGSSSAPAFFQKSGCGVSLSLAVSNRGYKRMVSNRASECASFRPNHLQSLAYDLLLTCLHHRLMHSLLLDRQHLLQRHLLQAYVQHSLSSMGLVSLSTKESLLPLLTPSTHPHFIYQVSHYLSAHNLLAEAMAHPQNQKHPFVQIHRKIGPIDKAQYKQQPCPLVRISTDSSLLSQMPDSFQFVMAQQDSLYSILQVDPQWHLSLYHQHFAPLLEQFYLSQESLLHQTLLNPPPPLVPPPPFDQNILQIQKDCQRKGFLLLDDPKQSALAQVESFCHQVVAMEQQAALPPLQYNLPGGLMRIYQDPDLKDKDVYAKKTATQRTSTLLELNEQNKARYRKLVGISNLRDQVDKMPSEHPQDYQKVLDDELDPRVVLYQHKQKLAHHRMTLHLGQSQPPPQSNNKPPGKKLKPILQRFLYFSKAKSIDNKPHLMQARRSVMNDSAYSRAGSIQRGSVQINDILFQADQEQKTQRLSRRFSRSYRLSSLEQEQGRTSDRKGIEEAQEEQDTEQLAHYIKKGEEAVSRKGRRVSKVVQGRTSTMADQQGMSLIDCLFSGDDHSNKRQAAGKTSSSIRHNRISLSQKIGMSNLNGMQKKGGSAQIVEEIGEMEDEHGSDEQAQDIRKDSLSMISDDESILSSGVYSQYSEHDMSLVSDYNGEGVVEGYMARPDSIRQEYHQAYNQLQQLYSTSEIEQLAGFFTASFPQQMQFIREMKIRRFHQDKGSYRFAMYLQKQSRKQRYAQNRLQYLQDQDRVIRVIVRNFQSYQRKIIRRKAPLEELLKKNNPHIDTLDHSFDQVYWTAKDEIEKKYSQQKNFSAQNWYNNLKKMNNMRNENYYKKKAQSNNSYRVEPPVSQASPPRRKRPQMSKTDESWSHQFKDSHLQSKEVTLRAWVRRGHSQGHNRTLLYD